MMDTITVLRCASSYRLSKLIGPTEIVPYDRARTFDAWTHDITGLGDLFELLQRLIAKPRFCVIRADLINGSTARAIRRLLHSCPNTGDPSVLIDIPHQWVALDIENVARPDTVMAADLIACANLALKQLPLAFSSVYCIVQASACHGIKPGVRLRLWFWLSRPASGQDLKRWLKGTVADPAVFNAVQPIYTAAPLFERGMTDPLPCRFATLPGAGMVEVPPPDALASVPRPDVKPLPHANSLAGSRYGRAALRNAAERVVSAPINSRHPTCLAQTRSLGRLVEAGLLRGDVVAATMIDALVQSGKSRLESERVVAWALAHPSTSALPDGLR